MAEMELDLRGLNPQQISDVGQFALNLGQMQQQASQFKQRQALQREQLASQEARARVQQKLSLLGTAINQKFQKRKLALEERRAAMLEPLYEAQTSQAQQAAAKYRREIEQMDQEAQFLERSQGTTVQTSMGELPLSTALVLGQRELPGFEITDTSWKSMGSFVDAEGNEVEKLLQPATGATTTRALGTTQPDETTTPKYASLAGMIESGAEHGLKLLGRSEFESLRGVQAQDKAADMSKVTELFVKYRGEDKATGVAEGTDATNLIKRYYKAGNDIPAPGKERVKSVNKVTTMLKQLVRVGGLAKETGVSLENTSFNKDFVWEQLLDRGYDTDEAQTIIDAAIARVRNAK